MLENIVSGSDIWYTWSVIQQGGGPTDTFLLLIQVNVLLFKFWGAVSENRQDSVWKSISRPWGRGQRVEIFRQADLDINDKHIIQGFRISMLPSLFPSMSPWIRAINAPALSWSSCQIDVIWQKTPGIIFFIDFHFVILLWFFQRNRVTLVSIKSLFFRDSDGKSWEAKFRQLCKKGDQIGGYGISLTNTLHWHQVFHMLKVPVFTVSPFLLNWRNFASQLIPSEALRDKAFDWYQSYPVP